MSLKFISYARKSSQGESRQVESIADQEAILSGVAEKESLVVVAKYSEARSAKEPHQRPAFRQMISDILGGKANSILCWHLNRLSRNSLESGELQWLLQSGKIKCIKTPEREYLPEDHALLMAVESSMAAQYVRDLKRDVERGVREKAKKGVYPYKPKPGYQLDPITRAVVADPVRFPLLRKAWEMVIKGAYSIPETREALNSWGYRTQATRSGGNKLISRSSIYRLFADPFYTGVFEFQGAQVLGSHPPMVTRQEFDKVQKKLSGPVRVKQEKHFHAYAGLMSCGVCGCQITAETHVKRYSVSGTSRSYTYYHCTGRKGCRKLSQTEEGIEETIRSKLAGCRLDPFFANWAIGVVERDRQEQVKLSKVSETAVLTSGQGLKRKIDALFDMRENGEIEKDEFMERKAKYQSELALLQQAKRENENKKLKALSDTKDLLVFSRDAYAKFTKGDARAKREVARAFAGSYVLTLDSLEIHSHPAHDLIRRFEPQETGSDNKKDGPIGAVRPSWRTMLDEIRKAVELAIGNDP